MESPEKPRQNPLKTGSETLESTQPEAKPMDIDDKITPTNYQLKVYEEAMKRNTIAFLSDTVGKSTVATMIINEMRKSLKNNNGDRKVIACLAPSVHLVKQLYEDIKSCTELIVEKYYGAKGVDKWDAKAWEKEIKEHDVLVMTPQVLLDALRKAYLSFEAFCFILLDECQCATGGHPYAKIMQEFYLISTKKPKIFGMASSLLGKRDSEKQLLELETLLDCQVYRTEGIEMEEDIPAAKCVCRFYDRSEPSYSNMKAKLESLWTKFDAVLVGSEKSLRERLANDISKILFCIENLGLLCAYEAVKLCIEHAPKPQEECGYSLENALHQILLQEVLSMLEESFHLENKKHLNVVNGGEDALVKGQISSKLHELFQLLRSLGKDMEALVIIYVEKIIAAEVIERVMKKISNLHHFNISYLTGSNSVGGLPPYCVGKVNLLFSTNELEEVIHVPNYSAVIHFDIPKTVHSFVQSREQALQNDCKYIVMLERGNKDQIDHVYNIMTEFNTASAALVGDPDVCPAKSLSTNETLACVNATGDKGTANSSIGDPNLHPSTEGCSLSESSSAGNLLSSRAGTTKRKELHGSVSVNMLSGTWGEKLDGVTFHAYKMEFECNITEEKYSNFVLLLETKLDDDVGNTEVQLYLISKSVKATVSFSGEVYLDTQQVHKAKCFHELMFNGLYGKLFVKSSGARKFLLHTEESLWDPLYMYLLLPLESVNEISEGPLKINWSGIESCVLTVDFLKKNALLNFHLSEATAESSAVQANDSVITEYESHVIHLANRSAHAESLKEVVVVAIHTGRIYSILDVVANSSAESPFEGDVDPSYSSFADYYKKKYGIVLKHPNQPLLLLKQSHNSHNLLVDFRNEGGAKSFVAKPQQHAHMPPELLVSADIRTYVLKSFYLLPSLMHRLESLMLACQLRRQIALCTGSNHNIPCLLILEALTSQRCNESFSMERLELLGDSVLKYTVSCHLFLKYPMNQEKKLSDHRSSIVSNSALHKFGTARKLQGYIRDCAFDTRRWTAPGQHSIWPSPCDHGLETTEVPFDGRFFTEDIKLLIGKTCDRGHRWMGSKTISDCVEALIGAYFVGDGLTASLHVMKWMGIEAEVDSSLILEAIKVASLYSYAPKANDISMLESKLGYMFSTKGLLLEAITSEQGLGYCYQRLEFLGDSVLDILITRHHYETHRDIDPGDLTDLRSASVSNVNFAIAAVRGNLHPHLQHDSLNLENQILAFVKCVSEMTDSVLNPDTKAPKELGDLVESIAGAVLIDSKLDLDVVWKVFKPFLSPIVTPEKLELPPTRELIELCGSLGYFIKDQYTLKGEIVEAEIKLQLEKVLLVAHGSGCTKKAARGMAALNLLKKLEARGISSSKRRQDDTDSVDASTCQGSDGNISCQAQSGTSESIVSKKRKAVELQLEINGDLFSRDSSKRIYDFTNLEIPVIPPIDTKKGGPRTSLFALCKKLQWPMPTFRTTEQKSRTPIQFGDTTGFNSYESQITLTIPDSGVIHLTGEARADKKSSFDSAALLMLYELERQGKIIIS